MIILEDILSQEIIQKLGWTLLHFIWQAAVLALLLAILLRLLRKSTPSLRYIIACLALGLIVLLPVITIQLVPVSVPQSAGHIEPAPAPAVLPMEEMPAAETIIVEEPEQHESVTPISADSWTQRAVGALEPALPCLVSGWLIGVFALSLWHLGGWTQLQRLKRRMVKQVDDALSSKLKVLAQRLRVKQTVQLMESALVQIPTVVGWLRPVILLPASALTGLTSEQLEAILAHELAHIKRFDYLINMLQTIVEILGFYHPAVWWISRKIRAERENCCDDLAVSISGDRVCYARALTSMEEIRADQGQLAVAATGGNLFRRIRRLVSKDSTEKTSFSWIPAVTVLLLIIALAIPTTLAFTTKSDSQQPDSKIDVHVENDRSGESQQEKKTSAESIPVPVLVKSPAPPDKDKTQIQIDCLIVEVSPDLKMDRETTITVENLLGKKMTLPSPAAGAEGLLRKAAEATAPAEDETARDKRVTQAQDQFTTLLDVLESRGYMKILMNPTLEVVDGGTAIVRSTQHVPIDTMTMRSTESDYLETKTKYEDVTDSLEITLNILEDGHITLQVEATISSRFIPKGIEQIPIVSRREISTRVRTSPGESLIIGGLKETGKSSETDRNVKGPKEKAKELLLILTPTIISTDNDSQKKDESAHKLKQLGLAVAMYADDHDDNLPDSVKELKSYIRDEQDFNWLLDNIKYLGSGKSAQRNAALIPIAYDRELLEEVDGTNVLSLDFSVRFLETKEFEKLDIKRAEFLIEARFLSVSEDFLQNIGLNANSPDEAKDLVKLKSEMLAVSDGSKTQSLILDERNVSLLLEAVRTHKDSKGLAAPQILTLEGKTAEIRVFNNLHFISGYTDPNRPSDKPEPKYDYVKEGISLSVKPKLTPKKNVDMEFELEITNVPSFEERKYKGKYPYKLPSIQSITQSTRYIAHNGQTLLCWGHKISKQKDGRTEQKDLLVLIKAQTVGSSEQDKSAQVEHPAVVEPTRTTSDVIMPPGIVQNRIERPNDNEQEKTRPATERRRRSARSIDDSLAKIDNKKQRVQIFKLKHHDTSQMARIVSPLLTKTGHVNTDERTNSLIVVDTAENLTRIEKIIAQFDVSIAEQAVQKSFKLKYRSPSQMARILRSLLTKTGHVSADESTGILLLIDTPENLKRIEKIIAAFDVLQAEQTVQKFFKLKYYSPSQMAQILKPLLTKTGYISADENTGNLLVIDTVENLKRIELIITEYDVPKADETVTEIFEIRYGDPIEIVELLKKLINGRPDNGSIIEQGKQPIVLIPEPSRKWIIAKASAENMKQISEWIAKLDREEPAPASLEQIDQQTIKQQKILKMRQDCINNDPVVKTLSENVANAEKELIVARQKLAESHPEVQQKAELLQLLKKRLDERITAVGKSFDDMMLPEPNLPLAPEVPLITNTWLESDMLEVLKDIASMAGIPIIPDETVVGLVTAELKDVSLDTALDIVLAGTPYVVKKTPYYYLVASAVEPLEIQKRVDSAKKLSNLGKALLIYANDHEDKYPNSLFTFSKHMKWQDFSWIRQNAEYLASGKTLADRPDIPLAYDKTLLAKGKGTNVLYNDCHVGFVKAEGLKKLGISESEIMIETVFLSVSEDYLKDVGLDANTANFSDGWTRHLAAKYPAGPNGQPYGLIIDDLHVRFLLRTVQAHHDSKAIVAPRVRTRAGTTTEIGITTEEYRYIKGYNEPNSPSEEPQPKRDKEKIGTHIWLTPKLTEDNRRVNLDLKLEIRQLTGIIEGKYKGKYPYYKPIIDIISAKMPCTIPDGKIMLIGGLKINEQIKKEPGTLGMKKLLLKEPGTLKLKDLPLIGGIFSSNDKIKDHKMLLVLVKPIINPQQKASKILRGEEDSEEHRVTKMPL